VKFVKFLAWLPNEGQTIDDALEIEATSLRIAARKRAEAAYDVAYPFVSVIVYATGADCVHHAVMVEAEVEVTFFAHKPERLAGDIS
jgi:hypothetical protein